MDIRPKKIDRQVKRMSDQEHHGKQKDSRNTAPHHASHLVHHGRDHSGGKPQRQQPGIGQKIRQPACDIVQIISAKRQPDPPLVFPAPSRKQQDAKRPADGHPLCQHKDERGESDLQPEHGCKHTAGNQDQQQSQDQ